MTEAEVASFMMEDTKSSLLEQARRGDPDAFAALLRPFDGRAYRIAVAMLGDPSEAQDALQDASTRAWRHLRRVRDPERVDGWFTTIVVNECRRRLGSPWRRVLASGLHMVRPDPGPSNDLDGNGEVRRALRGLDPDQRTVLILRHYFDLPLEQIADQLGIPLGTVKSRLNRGSERLRTALTAVEAMG